MAIAGSARAMTAAVLDRFSQLSAGYRLSILLTLALLPLGLLAVITSIQTSRSADLERRASVRVVAAESARRLASQLAVDSITLRSAANLLERGEDPASICARTESVLATAMGEPTRFALVSRTGRPVCGDAQVAAALVPADFRSDTNVRLESGALTLALAGDTNSLVGVAHYPRDQLARLSEPLGFTLP